MTDLGPSIIYLFFSLLVVLAIAWVVIKFLSRIYAQRGPSGEIQILSSFVLGARQQLYVVNFRDKDYLLGVTSERIDVLDSCLAKPEVENDSQKVI